MKAPSSREPSRAKGPRDSFTCRCAGPRRLTKVTAAIAAGRSRADIYVAGDLGLAQSGVCLMPSWAPALRMWDVRRPGRPIPRLAVTWQHPHSRRHEPVGLLTCDDKGFHFKYLHRASSVEGFQPFLGFDERDRAYSSRQLFSLFTQRIIRSGRPDFPKFLQALQLENGASDWQILARSHGQREGDGGERAGDVAPAESGPGCGRQTQGALAEPDLGQVTLPQRLQPLPPGSQAEAARGPGAVATRTATIARRPRWPGRRGSRPPGIRRCRRSPAFVPHSPLTARAPVTWLSPEDVGRVVVELDEQFLDIRRRR